MPRKVFKCILEISIHTVRSPGTWLPNRDDIYLTVEVLNCTKRTRLTDPIFPLIVHERFCFEKMFWSACDPFEVVEMLEDIKVSLELRQVADMYLGGTLLAYFDGNGREFFYPSSCSYPRCINDRELIMLRTIDFPGITPRVEFSTYTSIEECCTSYTDAFEDSYLCSPVHPYPRTECYSHCTPHYELPTVNSLLRSVYRSPLGDIAAAGHVLSDIHRHHFRGHRSRSLSPRRPRSDRRRACPLSRRPIYHDSLWHALSLSPTRCESRCMTRCRYPLDSETRHFARHCSSRSPSPPRSLFSKSRVCSPRRLRSHHHHSPHFHRSCETLSDLEHDLLASRHGRCSPLCL